MSGTMAARTSVVLRDGRPLGTLEFANRRRPIGTAWLRDAIAGRLGLKVLGPDQDRSGPASLALLMEALRVRFVAEGMEVGAGPVRATWPETGRVDPGGMSLRL